MSREALAASLGAQRLAGEVRRHRHRWDRLDQYADPQSRVLDARPACRCGAVKDPAKSRRGRTARQRGNRRELELARQLDGTKVGHHGGPEDVRAGMFVVQSKVRAAFPSWMTTELDKLPRTDGRIPLLIVTGPAGLDPHDRRKRPAIAVVHLADWIDLHGGDTDGDL